MEAISAILAMTMMEVEGIIRRETGVLGVYHSANISWMFLQAISQIRECGYQIISSAFQAEHHRYRHVNIVFWTFHRPHLLLRLLSTSISLNSPITTRSSYSDITEKRKEKDGLDSSTWIEKEIMFNERYGETGTGRA